MRIAATGFEQQHCMQSILTQAAGQHAAGGTGTDDDVVVGFQLTEEITPLPKEVYTSSPTSIHNPNSLRVQVRQMQRLATTLIHEVALMGANGDGASAPQSLVAGITHHIIAGAHVRH